MRARPLLAAVVALACAGCGSSSGLHLENGGRTVALRPLRTANAPPPAAPAPPQPGLHLDGPAAIAYDQGVLWCAVQPAPALIGSLVQVDTATGRESGPPIPLPPAGRAYLLAAGSDGVWLAAGRSLWRIDTGTGTATPTRLDGRVTAVLDAAGSVWVTEQTLSGGRLVRIDPGSLAAVATAIAGPAPSAVTVAAGTAWVTDSVDQSVWRFAIARKDVRHTTTIALPRSSARAPTQVTVYGNDVWVYERGRVLRIDSGSNQVVGTTRVASAADGTLAAGSGGIWVITRSRRRHRGAVRLLDASTGLAVGHPSVVGGRPVALATDGSGVWVFDAATTRLVRITASG